MNHSMALPISNTTPSTTVTQTVKKYGQQLLSFIKAKVKSLEDAEDILQDVWYQFSNLSSIEELESISGWLYFVARNKITDLYRKKKPVSLDQLTAEDEEGDFSIKEMLLIDDRNDPELALFKELFWKEMLAALKELPENQQQAFVLNEIEDKTLQEIADIQGVNIKTVISRKGYAVKHLREKLYHLYQALND
ncbi:MAG: RNA polymerase sigma factor [Ferruginibacter sp.]